MIQGESALPCCVMAFSESSRFTKYRARKESFFSKVSEVSARLHVSVACGSASHLE